MGRIIEQADRQELYRNPLHPYTKMLFSAIPKVEPLRRRCTTKQRIKGEVPGLFKTPSGCLFNPRCPLAKDRCFVQKPELERKNDNSGHFVACWEC